MSNLDLFGDDNQGAYLNHAIAIKNALMAMPLGQRVSALNMVRQEIAKASPFEAEPVDCVLWVQNTEVKANDYNPNSVAAPEMELLKLSILSDGYTQPIVAWPNNGFEVIDGFHRHRVGKEMPEVEARVHGYLPLAVVKPDRQERNDRMASTIRHNRARGKHSVQSMSDIVIELKKRNWSDDRIAKELGMDSDEVLRLCQVAGLSDVFGEEEFSAAWEAEIFSNDDLDDLTEDDING
jgi:ParB-like chromosome segregation protein Spo0J